MTGKLIAGRYEIEQELGRGGMGVVYPARDTRLGRTVALKMLPPEVSHDAELARRLAIEARAASALNHPGIATVYDYEAHAAERFIVYEYVDGVALRRQVGARRFSQEEILDLGAQLADAVAAAHDHGIIHRDLKPENILLLAGPVRAGRVKILDFGLAKLRGPVKRGGDPRASDSETETVHTSPGMQIGTVNYMSPEQVEGEPADARSDIFSLGLVIYELANGANPFVGKSAASTMANILRQVAPPLVSRSGLAPAELDRIVRKCLRKRPEERYQSARELRVDLANLRQDSSGGGPAKPLPGMGRRPDAPINVPRGIARGLVAAIQVGYLAMYGLLIHKLFGPTQAEGSKFILISSAQANNLLLVLFMTALAGAPVRLYVASGVIFDYEDFGRKYRLLFPPALLLDLIWALAPLLLGAGFGALPFLFIGGLAYLPLAQRRLIFDAYSPAGGRSTGGRAPS